MSDNIDKDVLKQALQELNEEHKVAAEKVAEEQADAFELGIHAFMKRAGISDPQDQEQFMAVCHHAAQQATASEA